MPELGSENGFGRFVNKLKGFVDFRAVPKTVANAEIAPLDTARSIDEEFVTQPLVETSKRRLNLGTQFQESIASLPEENIPPVVPSLGAEAILGTNEYFPDVVQRELLESSLAPDGYIFGAGFGNILSFIRAYPDNSLPHAIVSVDIMPKVVMIGRIFSSVLAGAENFKELTDKLLNAELIRAVHENIIISEVNPAVQARLKAVPFDTLNSDLTKAITRERIYIPPRGITSSIDTSTGSHTRSIVLAAVKENFNGIKQMARENNIGIALADMTNPNVLNVVKALPDFQQSRNIIYLSNVIDHITRRGMDLSKLNAMDPLNTLGSGEERGNWFVDTTTNSLNYTLRASPQFPHYTPSDVKYRIQ